jgi:hypothetical protein
VKITVTLDVDEKEWAAARGIATGTTATTARTAVRDDLAYWLRDALRAAPVPVSTSFKATHRNAAY